MRTAPYAMALSLTVAMTVTAPVAAQTTLPAMPVIKRPATPLVQPPVPTGVRTQFAPGQQDYTCNFTAGDPDVCRPITVQVWLIPAIKGGTAGCVAAFPYKSLVVPLTIPGSVDQFTLTWNLPAPPAKSTISYKFVGQGIEVTPIDEQALGPVSNLLSAPATVADTQVNWKVNVGYTKRFVGNHKPTVQYLDTSVSSTWNNCIPVDPVITNSD